RFGVEYSNLERDYEVNEKLLEQILERMRETSVSGTIESPNARLVDRAVPSSRPISPNYPLNIGLGLAGGLGIGLAFAFLVAYVDDRIKSVFDIEGVLGLSLVGVIPQVKHIKKLEEMHGSVAADSIGAIKEAFASLYSTLRLKEESRAARCILITSTIAGEGKSFITSNLASTFAGHGERVVVIDCDLRRPAINRAFSVENLRGLIDVCSGEALLDDVIVRNVRLNLDIIPTGGRSKNPTHVLNSREFAVMLSDLKKRYDRVFIDTPPIGIVSDALIILPLVDGSLYSVYFNKAKRKFAQNCVQRLLESNVPNFGAVMDGVVGGLGGYYHTQHSRSAYKDYYMTTAAANGNGDRHPDEANGAKLR
ncbi:MAG TPA: polysaccharide biosynthesis tyrosine autokinase, partial [Opitutaceae bacterium]